MQKVGADPCVCPEANNYINAKFKIISGGMDKTKISEVSYVTVYVDDFAASFKFYNEVLGLEKTHDMGDNVCFFHLGKKFGLCLEGGTKKSSIDPDTMRVGFVLKVDSIGEMYEKLKKAQVKFVQDAPVDMGGDNHWFQFYDPSGNILEIIGGK
jgi:predicted enzyme related to lactoylglutathione lyase